jgi:hypothetical protein
VIGKLLNALGYQGVWIASVAGASRGMAWVGPVCAVAFACAVLATSERPRVDARLMMLAIAVGATMDSAWIALGWLDFNAAWPSAAFAPAWILGLWLSLALTLDHSLAFLRDRVWLAAVLGGAGGPLAYWAASRSGAVRLDAPVLTVLAGLGVAWALLFPMLVRAAGSRPKAPVRPVSRQVPL